MFLKRIKTYKNGNISTLHRDVKNRRIAAPHVLNLVFLDYHLTQILCLDRY